MTKDRKNKIRNIKVELTSINDRLGKILNEEECSYDCMPENLQGSVRGLESEDAIDILSEAVDNLNEIISSLDDIF